MGVPGQSEWETTSEASYKLHTVMTSMLGTKLSQLSNLKLYIYTHSWVS